MGTDNTLVIAQWDRSLVNLQVNSLLDVVEPDGGFSWSRPDGWQCFAPDGSFYPGALVPPVDAIRREVGGPVLGLGVASSSHWEALFTDEGGARWLAGGGGTEDHTSAQFEAAMVERWGEPWQAGGAAALAQWAAPFATVDEAAIRAALSLPYVLAESLLFELQRTLTLVPEPGHPWWSSQDPEWVPKGEIPGSYFAVDAVQLKAEGVLMSSLPERSVVVAFCESGVGLWDRAARVWLRDPDLSLDSAMSHLPPHLLSRGWTRMM